MRLLLHGLTVITAATLGLTLGWAWRAKSPTVSAMDGSPSAPSSSHLIALPEAPARSASRIQSARIHDDSPLATRMARDLEQSSGVTRWLIWIEGIETASVADFPRLAQLARAEPVAARLLAARWVEVDHRNLFETLAAPPVRGCSLPGDELASVLFEEWPRRDPDGAIAALSGTNHFGIRDKWRLHVASLLVEKDPERGLRVLSEWQLERFVPRMSGIAKWATTDPRRAAEAVLAHPAGLASQAAMQTIGGIWAKSDPEQALEFVSSRPDELGTVLAGEVLRNWAGSNLRDASAWLASADDVTRDRYSPAVVEAWARSDPAGALAWCASHLSGPGLALAVGGALKGAAQRDVTAASAIVAAMEPSAARAEAAAAVAQQWFPGSLSGKPVPPATLEWLAGLDDASVRRVLEQVQWRWSIGDPRSMASFLRSSANDRVPATADATLARNLARQSPLEALAWSNVLPDQRRLLAGSEAFAEWRRAQPAAALQWLNELASTDPRRQAFLRSSSR